MQTEDSGIKNPVIITHLYFRGSILASKKISYAHFAAGPDYKEKVRELMKEQHKSMIKELIRGVHTAEEAIAPPEAGNDRLKSKDEEDAPKGQISKSLDDVLLEFILKKGHNPE